MNKIKMIIMLVLMGFGIGAAKAQTNWGGSGTVSEPYTISNAAGLVELATNVNAGTTYAGSYFKLTDDIDLSSVCGESVGNWTPIGTAPHHFSGVFDGSNYTIDYLYINNNSSYQGLFGYAVGAVIKNVKIGEHSSVSGSIFVGALVGGYDVNESQAGGVIFDNCVNYATVKGYYRVGGLLGSIWNQNNNNEGVGQFNACINHGTVQSVAYSGNPEETGLVGGLFGEVNFLPQYKYQCQFIGCKNFGAVTNQYSYTGGIFGAIGNNSTVKQCENHGIVTGVGNTGGIMGSVHLPLDELAVESCHNYAQVNGIGTGISGAGVGGIVGGVGLSNVYRQTQVLSSCINEGKVEASGALAVGGVIGLLNTSAQSTPGSQSYLIENCQNQSAVSGSEGVGGVLGVCGILSSSYDPDAISVEGKFMNECSNLGNISGNNYVGGICGCNHYDAYSLRSFGGKITNCENTGKVTTIVTSYSNGGGIIADGNTIVVENCTNSGEIEGVENVGGICGKLKDSEVTACQNSGAVTGNYAGGIVGDGEIIEVANCTNLGEIDGAQSVGGITGTLASGTISSSFNTGDIEFNGSGAATVGGGIVGFVVSLSPDAVGSTIQYCYNMGNIKSNSISESERVLLGGIVGMLNEDGSVISNCYNSGVLSSVEVSEGVAVCIGGIISYISNAALTLTNSYNVGNFVYPNATVLVLGGVVAAVEGGDITISNCFYDKQMCPVVNEFCPDADGTPLLTSAMTNGSWIPGGSAFTVSNGLYPQLTVFATSPATALDQAASIVSVTPAFLENEENVEGVATNFTVGTGNEVAWSAASPFSYSEGEVSFSTEGTGTLTVSKTVSDITVSKDIVMTTIIDDVCWAGSGTVVDPYRIEDAAGLVCLAENVNAGESYAGVYFKMMNNIDLSSVCGEGVGNWTPIGTSSNPFKGVFNGANNTISNLYINGEGNGALFGDVSGATIKKLTVNGEVNVQRAAGICVSSSNAYFEDCVNNVNVSGGNNGAAGVVLLQVGGTISNCSNYGNISGKMGAAGIAGMVEDAPVTGCMNFGTVECDPGEITLQDLAEGNFTPAAGIVAYVNGSSTVSSSVNCGWVKNGHLTGGICGFISGYENDAVGHPVVDKCMNFGPVEGNDVFGLVGGVVGNCSHSSPGLFSNGIQNCYNAGMVSAHGVSGGIAGYCEFDLTNCYNVGNVYSTDSELVNYGGRSGIVGILADDYDETLVPQVINCYYDKQMCTAEYMYYFSEDTEFEHLFNPTPVPPTEGQTLLTSSMIGTWNPLGDAFATAAGLYPQLTVFSASSDDLTKAASIVSVTPAFLNGVENVEGVATSPFTVGTGNSVSWSAASPFNYDEGDEVSFSAEGTGTLTVSKTVSDITVSKDIVMTTIIEDVCWAGLGTVADPYQIVDADGLVCLAEKVNDGNSYAGVYFKMMNDIDLSDVCGEGNNWTPIGNASDSQFEGIFNGGNNAIESLYISDEYSEYQGLFGRIENAEISGLTIRNSLIEGRDYVAAICGDAIGSIFNNCHNASSVNLIGSGSKAHVSIGGICAEAEDSRFISCSNSGCVDDSKATPMESCYVAGICSYGQGNTSFLNCYNTGAIIGDESSGICSSLEDEASIAYCYNTGTIIGKEIGGGICASTGGTIANCYNVGLVQGTECASGIVASMGGGNIESCFNMGEIIYLVSEEKPGMCFAAGISGFLEEATVSNCYNTGNVLGFGAAGGLFGLVEDSEIENCYNVGQVNCIPAHIEEDDYVEDYNFRGGIIGVFDTDPEVPSTITNCYYDKQMCTAPNAYYTVDEETGEFLGVPGADYQKLTTEMVGSALSSEYTDGWTFVGSGYTALYPQLTAFVESENDIDNEASLVSVRPMFLAETDNVDHVYTSPFTVGIDDDEEWSHVSGEELLTFNADGTVEWEDYGTETVAVTNKTHDFITKQIKLNTLNLQDITWVDWVTEAPSGFDPANIDSPEDLAWFISYVNGFNGSDAHPSADGEITADIDMSEHYWVPIGFYCGNICTEHQITYTGKFLGNFHNIDGIRVDWNALVNSPVLQTLAPVSSGKQNRDGNDYLGMFGSICNDTIVHVFVTSGSIVGDEDYDGGGMGGLVGCAEGSVIWNCYSNASVFQNAGSSKGGLVGVAKVYSGDDKGDDGDGEGVPTIITGSSCTADITGNGEMGGILGWSKGAVIRDCYANVKFTIQDNFGSKDHEFNSQVGCLVGASGKGFVEIYNSYVRMRGYEIIEKGGGEEQAHCVGMIIGEAQGETIDHCYVPADSPYGYVGRSENVKEVFAQVPFDDGSKGDDPIFRLSVKNGGHSYYLMSLDNATDAVFQNCEQVDIEGDTYEIFEPNEEDGHLYISNDGSYYSFFNSRKGYLAVDGEGQLTYSNATPVLWNVEPNDTYGSFKLYTTPEAEQLYLGMKDGYFGVFAQGTEGCNFDIYAFMSIQMASEANIQNCGKFATTVYPYTYANPEGGNIITLDGDDDEIVESGKTTLLDALNNWDLYHSGDEDISVSMDWARFGSALNGDYPVHCYYNPDNLTEGDAVKPTAKVITTPDKTNGFPFRFYSHVGDALNYYNNLENGGILCVYGSDDMSGAAVQSNDNDVDVYVNGMTYMKCPMNEDASKDWYVSLLQGSGSTLNVHSGFYLDNSDASGEVGGGTDDWHMVSSPLAHVPVGIAYANETQQPYMTPANCSWDDTKDGLFPTDTPLDSYDFYAYSEPDYHWINLKQNSASHYHQDDGNAPIEYENDTELKAGHGYLIAMDKEVFMQTSGTLNNRDIEVPVTYSGAHNKGLNFLGNPYLSSLDFDEFATANGSLWEGGAYAESYITLDADKKGYITYAKGQSENPEGLSRYVWPNQGFYIAADNADTATFTNAMRVIKTDKASYFRGEEQPNYALVNLKATDSEGNRDMLTVELGRPEVGGARKERNVRNGNGLLYSHYQGGDYSVVFTEEGASQVPVWFESREDDTYTMTWSTYNGTFSYLHLIDNLTGADVDMLANAEYRYASASSDYASRFRLVFAYTGIGEEESEGEGQFVFQSGDELVVTGEGEVDIIDLNGRVIRHSRATGTQTAIAMPAVARGIYMVRLTSANGVKVNKIVVR